MLGRFEDFSANGKAADEAWLEMLATSLKPFMLRRTKEQVLKDLPRKTEQTIMVELKDEERDAYDELRDWYRGMLTKKIDEVGFGRAKIHVLEALLRLRQAACHPGLIDPERMDEPSAKIDALMEMLEEVTAAGHKALVFSQFTTLLEIVRRRVEKTGIPYCYLDGATRDRRAVCDAFQTDPEGGRLRPEPDGERLRLHPRSLVESGGRVAGDRSRASDGTKEQGVRLPADRQRDGGRQDREAAGGEAQALRCDRHRRRQRPQRSHRGGPGALVRKMKSCARCSARPSPSSRK
jgi:hypothetical protein